MTTDTPWEPPLAGTEVTQLLGALDRIRATFRWKVDGLDAAGLSTTIGASSPTLGGLLKHLALVEDHKSTTSLTGASKPDVWDDDAWDDDPDWEFVTGATDSPASLYALWDGAVARARTLFGAAIEDGGLDQLVHVSTSDGEHASLRRLLTDLLEEYARHTGHADLIREAVDGRTGEDPPAGWVPVG